jgi:hypothetical protein
MAPRLRLAPVVLVALFEGVLACGAPAAAPAVPPPPAGSIASVAPEPIAVPPTPAPSEPPPVAPAPPPEPPPSRPTLTVTSSFAWVYGRPKADDRYIGSLRLGAKVTLRSEERVPGEHCKDGFFTIEPRGFVCADHRVTLTPTPPFVTLARATAAATGPLPYRYAFSDGAPMYRRVPTPEEQEHAERRFGRARSQTNPTRSRSSYEDLASTDPFEPVEPAPSFLSALPGDPHRSPVEERIPAGSMLAFTSVVSAEGRTFLLSADHTLVPADRMRLFRKSAFHGARIEGDVALPLAWFRKHDRPQYRRLASGELERAGGMWPARTFVRLTGATADQGRKHYHETMDHEGHDPSGATLWVADEDASIVTAATKLATGVKPDQKWILVHLGDATLVAYEGLRPVYTTLVSPGRGGIPVAGRDNVEASTTPLGTFYVTFKDRATTMTHDKPGEPRTHWIADVPFTQYFSPPFALHAAYWHDRFGEDTSAGCINLSPADAEILFGWSDPPVPPEWQGVTGSGVPENGPTTAIVVRR